MESYIDKIKNNAEQIIKETFPLKALELDILVSTNKFQTSQLQELAQTEELPKPEDFLYAPINGAEVSDSNASEIHQENTDEQHRVKKRKFEHIDKSDANEIPGCKVILFPNGAIPCNRKVAGLIRSIKPYIVHFLDSSAVIKLWIQILIPKVEDFKAELSLQIQEDCLAEIRSVEAEVASYLDHIYKYHTVRGKFISKLVKFPHVGDFKQSIIELDEKMFMTCRLVALELRNHYTTVHDNLTKNLEKIKKPRSSNEVTMY